jgi:5-methylcytosine-specific restriction enzyme A
MFEITKSYKRSEIHDQYGGNRQRGIVNCPSHEFILIFTKSKKSQSVYVDEWKDDYFYYSGEGRVGDMEMTGGNKAIWNHESNNKKIHLFKETNTRGFWEYVDELKLVDINYYRNLDDNNNERQAFQFVLLSATKENKKEVLNSDVNAKAYNYNKPNQTERKGLVVTRVGQGYYRKQLLERWENRCAVTNSSIANILIASHIVPWRKSNDFERLDVGNGILLSPNIDALFDKHLITFEDDGKIRISKKLTQNQLFDLGVTNELKLRQVFSDMFKYLAMHREEFSESEKL